MRKIELNTEMEVADYVSDCLANEINIKENPWFILASGGTPTLAFNKVAGKISRPEMANNTTIIKLDEWLGLGKCSTDTCDYYLQENVVKPWGIRQENYISFNAEGNPDTEVDRIRHLIHLQNSSDVCVLGLGLNGHIGFIEPSDSLPETVSVVKLDEASKNHPMVSGKYEVKNGITIGLSELFMSKRIILMVTGAHKKEIFSKFLESDITTKLPATLLKMHSNFEVVFDKSVLA